MDDDGNKLAAKAICGAFLAVAFADAQFDPSEEGRFLTTVANDPSLAEIDTENLEFCYNELVQAFSDNYAGAAASVLAAIQAVSTNEPLVCAVKMSARRAIVADDKIMGQEELALDHIALALGLEKGSV